MGLKGLEEIKIRERKVSLEAAQRSSKDLRDAAQLKGLPSSFFYAFLSLPNTPLTLIFIFISRGMDMSFFSFIFLSFFHSFSLLPPVLFLLLALLFFCAIIKKNRPREGKERKNKENKEALRAKDISSPSLPSFIPRVLSSLCASVAQAPKEKEKIREIKDGRDKDR